MNQPSEQEVRKLYYQFIRKHDLEYDEAEPSEAFVGGYLLCWKHFIEFIKSGIKETEEP